MSKYLIERANGAEPMGIERNNVTSLKPTHEMGFEGVRASSTVPSELWGDDPKFVEIVFRATVRASTHG